MNDDKTRAKEDKEAKEMYGKINCVIKAVEGRLVASELDQIKEYNRVGEYLLAVETLLFDIVHEHITLSPPEKELLIGLARRMKADEKLWSPL